MGQLQPLNLTSFVGGLNARRSQFTLGDDESPDMLNIEIDPRAGFFTRKGWERWNEAEITTLADWTPRSAVQHLLSSGTFDVYVANDAGTEGEIFRAPASGAFADLSVPCNAYPHMADFAIWGDLAYIATGRNAADVTSAPTKVDGGTPSSLADASTAFNDDYTTPAGGTMMFADLCEPHASYLFVAGTKEGGVQYPNRVRWSHPDEPEDWATNDFLDINIGGGRITGLMSFRDHLLIFKTDSVWALYGYDLDSWQLVQVSASIGCPQPGAMSRSEDAAYFYSASDRGGVYAYAGQAPIHITEKLRTLIEEIQSIEDVFVEWTSRRLWVATPTDVLVFDPEIGNGAWVRHRPSTGTMGPIVARSDVDSEFPLACLNQDCGAAILVRLEARDDTLDVILDDYDNNLIDLNDDNFITDLNTGGILLDEIGLPGEPFESYYRTRWLDAGWPDRRKSWRRPRFLFRVPAQTTAVRADVFWDYEETNSRRTRTGMFTPDGGVFWTAGGSSDPTGFDWGDGSEWGRAAQGGTLERVAVGLGVNRAIQIKVTSDPATPGAAWAIDGLFFKFLLRRFTT